MWHSKVWIWKSGEFDPLVSFIERQGLLVTWSEVWLLIFKIKQYLHILERQNQHIKNVGSHHAVLNKGWHDNHLTSMPRPQSVEINDFQSLYVSLWKAWDDYKVEGACLRGVFNNARHLI